MFFTHAYYNKLLIALKVNVKSKIVAYLRFVDIVNIHLPIDSRPYTEAPAQYTVDVLDTSTYAFPTGSTAERQLRLYFEDGTYRIIGTRDHTSDDTEYFKNYCLLFGMGMPCRLRFHKAGGHKSALVPWTRISIAPLSATKALP